MSNMKLRVVSKLLYSLNRRNISRRLQTTVASQSLNHSNVDVNTLNDAAFANHHRRRDFNSGGRDRYQNREVDYGDTSLNRKFSNLDAEARRFGRVDPKALESYLYQLKIEDNEISSPIALKLLSYCGSYLPMLPPERRIDMLNKVWDMLQDRNFALDISHYNTLITQYLENDHDFLPIDFLATLEKNGVEPNRVTFQRLIRRFAQMGDLNGVGTILEHMKSLEMPITEQVCNSLLFANVRAKNEQELQSVLQFMKDNDLELTSESYYDMMCAYAANKDFESIKKILEEHNEMVFTDAQILDVIYSLLKNGIDKTKELMPFIRKAGGFVHEALNASLKINALNDYSEAAVEILTMVQRPTTSTGEPIDFGGALLQQASELNFSREKIMQLCKSLDEKNINNHGLEACYVAAVEKPDQSFATHLMETMVEKYKADNRAVVRSKSDDFDEMARTPVGLRPHCFYPLILMYSRQSDFIGLKRVLDMIRACNCTLDILALSKWMWPYLPENIRDDLSSIGMIHASLGDYPMAKIVSSFFFHKIQTRQSDLASEIMKNQPQMVTAFVSTQFVEHLVGYAIATGDIDMIVDFLAHRQANYRSSKDLTLVDTVIYEMLMSPDYVESLLSELIKKEVGASAKVVERFRNLFERKGYAMDKLEELALLGQKVHLKIKAENFTNMELPTDITTMDKESLIEYVQKSSYPILSHHMQALIRNQRVDELLYLHSAMDELKKFCMAPMYISTMNLMIKSNKMNEAIKFFNLSHIHLMNGVHNVLTINLVSYLERAMLGIQTSISVLYTLIPIHIYSNWKLNQVLLKKCSVYTDLITIDRFKRTLEDILTMKLKSRELVMAANHLLNFFIYLADNENFTDLFKCVQLLNDSTPTSSESAAAAAGGRLDGTPSALDETITKSGFQFSSQLKEHLLEGLIQKIFDGLADVSDGQALEERVQIFEALCKYKEFNVSNLHSSFAIDRLISDDHTDIALRVFDIIYTNTKKLTKPTRLMQALARKDNVADLQKVYDCMVATMGDNRATIKLALCLAVVGRTKDAMRVLAAPNVRFGGDAIIREGTVFYDYKDAQGLKSLLELSRGKNVYAREKLYMMLLTLYRQQKDYSSALNVWTTMQEENFITSKPILDLISEILKENGQQVPFETTEEKLTTTAAPPKFSAATSSLMSKLMANSEKSPSLKQEEKVETPAAASAQ